MTKKEHIITPFYYAKYLDELSTHPAKKKDLLQKFSKLSDEEKSLMLYEIVGKNIYKEYPVDIHTFIHDSEYMGSMYSANLYTFWEETLADIYPAPLIKKYTEGVLSCATRAGKSTVGILSAFYEIYLLSCMINPISACNVIGNTQLVFAFLSKDNSNACLLTDKIFKGIKNSPCLSDYAYSKLSFSSVDGDGAKINKDILVKAGSSLGVITGTDLYFGLLDEANMPSNNIAASELTTYRMNMYNAMLERKQATLDKAPKSFGMIWIMSSPTDEGDVIGEVISDVKDKNKKNVKILDDIPRWTAQGIVIGNNSFDFFLGSDIKDPCILDEVGLSREDFNEFDRERIIKIPEKYRNLFKGATARLSIQEIAGRRTTAEYSLFDSVDVFKKVFKKENKVFCKDELEIDMNSFKNLEDYLIDKDYFSHCDKPECYRFIHLDIASKTDRFGLSSVYSDRIKLTSEENDTISVRKYYEDFTIGIKAKNGSTVDIVKVLEFIYGLKSKGYPIKLVTTDSHQGTLARQIISKHGIDTEYLSVEVNMNPYYFLKNSVLTQVLEGHKNPLLTKELKGLRVHTVGKTNKQKIEKGKGYTDDLSDSLAGALFSCSQDSEYKTCNQMIDELLKFREDNISPDDLSISQLTLLNNAQKLNKNNPSRKNKNLGLGF